MKKYLILPLALCLVGCAAWHKPPEDPYLPRAKRALAIAKTAYLAASGVYIDAKAQGLLEPDEVLKIESLDAQVREAYAVAVEAVEAADEAAAKAALVRLLGTAQILVDALSEILPYDAERAVRIALLVMGQLMV